MEFRTDSERTGAATPIGRRSAARIAMDKHADTGDWMVTEVPTGDVDQVLRRLRTLAHKAGYSLRTERCAAGDGISTKLRLLVRSKEAARGAA